MKRRIFNAAVSIFFVFLILILPCSALSTSQNSSSKVWYPLLDFDVNINSSTFDLCPALRENSSQTNTSHSVIGVTDRFITRSNITISDPSTSTIYKAWRDLSYFLKMELQSDQTNFDMVLSCDLGVFNFTSYDVPYITVPVGYRVEVSGSYRFYYTSDVEDVVYRDITLSGSYNSFQVVPLLNKQYMTNGVVSDVLGDVLITDYDVTLSFVQTASNAGQSGYYVFNQVLSWPSDDLYGLVVEEENLQFVCSGNDVYVIGTLSDGSSQEFSVDAFYFTSDFSDLDLGYEISPDYIALVYDFTSDTWRSVDVGTDGTISSVSIRQLYFGFDLDSTFDTTAPGYQYFREWFISNTVYSDSSVVTLSDNGSLIGNVNGLFVSYVGSESPEVLANSALTNLYRTGYADGVVNGSGDFNGDYVSWAANSVKGFMDLQIFPGFSIGGLLGTLVAICCALLFLKFFAGG